MSKEQSEIYGYLNISEDHLYQANKLIENRVDAQYYQIVVSVIKDLVSRNTGNLKRSLNNLASILYRKKIYSFDYKENVFELGFYRILSSISKMVENEPSKWLDYPKEFSKLHAQYSEIKNQQIKNRLNKSVVSVAFSFEEIEEGRWVCWVGCVQGHALKMHQATKLIQKLMHGLRPNSFIVVALQDLCRNLGCDAIYCVADSAHSYRKKHAVHLPWRHKIDFDYDEFWQDIGAKKVDQHWFELPLVRARKEMSELKTKKRAMYRKRYTMLDEVAINISNAVNR